MLDFQSDRNVSSLPVCCSTCVSCPGQVALLVINDNMSERQVFPGRIEELPVIYRRALNGLDATHSRASHLNDPTFDFVQKINR